MKVMIQRWEIPVQGAGRRANRKGSGEARASVNIQWDSSEGARRFLKT